MISKKGWYPRLRYRWQLQQRFTAHGAQIVLRTNRASAMPRLLTRLPIGSELVTDDVPSPPDRLCSIVFPREDADTAVLICNGKRTAVCSGEAELLDAFERDAAYRVAETARDRVFIHCGVVSWRGRAILIPGRTCYGKTTLVTRFLEAGATYYSDEYAPLDSQGRVYPYARPLQIRRQHGSLVQTSVKAEELAGTGGIGREPIQPALMLCCRYRAGSGWRPRELTAGAAALELIRFSFTAFWSPESAFHTASETASRLSAWRGSRGEAKPVVEWALKRLDAGD
jgi:hypothetical protein